MSRKKRGNEHEQKSGASVRSSDEHPRVEAQQGPTARAEGDADALRTERDDLLARLQRLGADYQNYQKRVRKDIEQAREFANEQLIRSLLSVLDDMERALQSARENHDDGDALLKGMQLVHDKALETLKQFGLGVIKAAGMPFDPQQHSAVMQQARDDVPPQTVIDEVQRGYTLKGRTIRPASVVVSRAPLTQDEQQAPQDRQASAEQDQEDTGA